MWRTMAAGLPPKNSLLRDALYEPEATCRGARFSFRRRAQGEAGHSLGSESGLASIP
jgi:hypothetical protein